jgi:TIR domain
MAKVFFSYSHKDEELRNRLETHLALLKRQGIIETWHDRRIEAGQDFSSEIDVELDAADVILLLVSADFISSDYCFEAEMKRALERHEKGEARVIPVILRHCDWKSAPFGKLQAAPKDAKPITSWPDIDEALTDVARMLRLSLTEVGGRTKRAMAPRQVGSASHSQTIRSSNLRIRRTFSEAERDAFELDAFEFMARYFGELYI